MTLFVGMRGVQGIECNRLDFNLGSIQVLFTCVLATMPMRCNGKNLSNVNKKTILIDFLIVSHKNVLIVILELQVYNIYIYIDLHI